MDDTPQRINVGGLAPSAVALRVGQCSVRNRDQLKHRHMDIVVCHRRLTGGMRPMLAGIVIFLISVTASGLAKSNDALPSYNQHYGEIADPSVWPISAVGVVTVALFSRKMYCTGTLVAPKLVLTAAHCLFNGKLLVSSGNVRFLAALNKGVPAAHADAKRLVVPKEFSPGPPTQESVVNDWAIIVLSDAISTKSIPVKPTTRDELRTVVNSDSAMQVGYGRDRLYLPTIVRGCSVSEGPDNRFFKHKCLTNFGYSGAPILAQIGGEPAVIGINSIGDPQRRTGMACSATQFAKAIGELASE
jgi:secreted trypsin-like serine protease